MKAKITNLINGQTVTVKATAEHPDSHYGLPVWVDEDNIAYAQVGLDAPFYKVHNIEIEDGDTYTIEGTSYEIYESRECAYIAAVAWQKEHGGVIMDGSTELVDLDGWFRGHVGEIIGGASCFMVIVGDPEEPDMISEKFLFDAVWG